ncbi:hypothetical protein C8R43DRAFT_966316 [Mycena crocata]|nr:hypothetical protein C8R43DRAFT_966316 [Mycena crocata]
MPAESAKVPAMRDPTLGSGNPNSQSPVGLIWDADNWSCGYDAFLTPLACILREDPQRWSANFTRQSGLLGLWAARMQELPAAPEIARDDIRRLLHFSNADAFPVGRRGILIDNLFMALTDRESYGSAVTYCEHCNYRVPGLTSTFGQLLEVGYGRTLESMYPGEITMSQWLQWHFDRYQGRCPTCIAPHKMRRVTTLTDVPQLLVVTLAGDSRKLRIEEVLTFGRPTGAVKLRVRGLLYHSETGRHFTSIVVDAVGTMWYHDGITTRRRCIDKGRLRDVRMAHELHAISNTEKLCGIMYAREE